VAGDGRIDGTTGHVSRDHTVVRLLHAHAIPEPTARLLVPVGDTLRREAVRLRVEHAASFDIDTGAAAGPLRVGRTYEVDISDQIEAMRPDRRYVSIHTHSSNAAFSDRDLELLLKNDPITTVESGGFFRMRSDYGMIGVARRASTMARAVRRRATRRTPSPTQPTQPAPAAPQQERAIIDDTLATTAVFHMDWHTIPQRSDDPEGIRIGDQVAEELLRRLAATGKAPQGTA
jgi:hypothetical protein